MKLLERTKITITKDRKDENVPHSKIIYNELKLVHCNIVNNDYQQNPWVLYTLVSNNTLEKLLEIALTNFIFLKTIAFSYIEVWFTGQNSKSLEIEDKAKIILVINLWAVYKIKYSIKPWNWIIFKYYKFLPLA